jgi:hypothetical protein
VRSARSSLRHNALPHLLFASADVERLEGLTAARFEPSAIPYVDKITNMRRSQFERAIYPATVVERVRVIHGEHVDYDALAARINSRQLPRTWPPPLPLRAKLRGEYEKLLASRRTSRRPAGPPGASAHGRTWRRNYLPAPRNTATLSYGDEDGRS